MPRLSIEPGRAIVAAAAVTLYTVGTIKELPGIRTYVAVDGGMSDNVRPALYGSSHEALLANLNAYMDSVNEKCSGTITMRLFKGSVRPVARESPHALYDQALDQKQQELCNHRQLQAAISRIENGLNQPKAPPMYLPSARFAISSWCPEHWGRMIRLTT